MHSFVVQALLYLMDTFMVYVVFTICRYGINHSDIQVMYYGPTLGYVQDPSTRWVLDLFVKSSHVKTMKTYIIDYKIRNIICHWYTTNFLNFWILEIKMEEIIIYGISSVFQSQTTLKRTWTLWTLYLQFFFVNIVFKKNPTFSLVNSRNL